MSAINFATSLSISWHKVLFFFFHKKLTKVLLLPSPFCQPSFPTHHSYGAFRLLRKSASGTPSGAPIRASHSASVMAAPGSKGDGEQWGGGSGRRGIMPPTRPWLSPSVGLLRHCPCSLVTITTFSLVTFTYLLDFVKPSFKLLCLTSCFLLLTGMK